MLERLAAQPRQTLLVGLGAIVAVLAIVNVWVATAPVDVSPVTGPGAVATGVGKTATGGLKTPLDARPVASFSETVNRPIFNPGRKPVERQAVAGPAIGGPEDLRLVGILQTAGGTKRALIRAGGDSKGQWLEEGGSVSGWIVKSIGPRSVVVASGGRDYEIAMSKGASR